MTNWMEGHNDQCGFKAFVNHDGVFSTLNNWCGGSRGREKSVQADMCLTSRYTTEELFFPEREFKGVPWESENYNRWNPQNHISKWKTPMMVIRACPNCHDFARAALTSLCAHEQMAARITACWRVNRSAYLIREHCPLRPKPFPSLIYRFSTGCNVLASPPASSTLKARTTRSVRDRMSQVDSHFLKPSPPDFPGCQSSKSDPMARGGPQVSFRMKSQGTRDRKLIRPTETGGSRSGQRDAPGRRPPKDLLLDVSLALFGRARVRQRCERRLSKSLHF